MNIIDSKYFILEYNIEYWSIGIKLLEIGPSNNLICFGFSILCFHFHFGNLYHSIYDIE